MLAFYVVAAERQGIGPDRAGRDDPDRHPEGVHRAEGVVLPGRPGDAAGDRHGGVVRRADAALASDQYLGLPHPRGGSTAAQELAFTLKDGLTYVEHAVARGLDVDDFAPRLSFFFNAQIDFFEEIAKYRAARRIWARELKNTFGARKPGRGGCGSHADRGRLADRPAAAEQHRPHGDRGARGGARRHAVAAHHSYDEALALPTEAAVRIALRTQQIIAEEPGREHDRSTRRRLLRRGADRSARAARVYSSARSTSSVGWSRPSARLPQREIADAAFELQQEIDAGRRTVVGVNRFTEGDEGELRSCGSTPHSSNSRSRASRPPARTATPTRSKPRWARSPTRPPKTPT